MQRYFGINKINDEIILKESDIHHIKNVMRMKVFAKIEVVYENTTYLCEITNLKNFQLKIIKTNKSEDQYSNLTMVISLLKEQKQDLVLQKLTELGVEKIIPLKLERCVVKLDLEKEIKKLKRWEEICKEASEQSKRTNIPKIEKIHTINDLEKIDADYKFVLSTKENEKNLNMSLQKVKSCDKIIILVGPEGGITNEEENYLNQIGFESVSLGNNILRAETASIYIASIIKYLYMR